NASGMRLTLTNVFFFVGVNGAFTQDVDGNVTGLDLANAVGFSVNNAGLDLVIVNETAGAMRKWMGVAAHVGSMGVSGLPNVFELEILNLDLRFNGKAADQSKLAWNSLAGLAGDPFKIAGTQLAQIQRPTDISVTGQLYINISGFVIALAGFSIEQQSGMSLNDGAGINLAAGAPGANALVIRITGAYLFVGVSGAATRDIGGNVTGLDLTNAIGFFVNNASLDLAIVSEAAGVGARKWVGVAAHIDSLGVTGLPSAFSLKIKDLDILFNVPATGGSRMDWDGLAANAGDGFTLSLGLLSLLDRTVDFKVAGSVYVAIENFVYVS